MTNNYYAGILDQALMELMHKERLSQEASMEELCKILLVKLCYERKNQNLLTASDLTSINSVVTINSLYDRLFQSYVPSFLFAGWEKIDVRLDTFCEVVVMLQTVNFAEGDNLEKGKEFTAFLQRYYGWYVNDYSTPAILTDFIYKVIDVKNFVSMFDPCCGIGGMLAMAYSHKGEHLHLCGNDISQAMVNITRLHLKFYGYEGDDFTCKDYTDKRANTYQIQYDCIVAQPPTRRQAFSLAGRRDGGYGEDYYDSDMSFVANILHQLKEGGVAAIVVSENIVNDYKKRNVRDFLMYHAEILNITKFEDVVTKSNYHKKSYYILFIRKTSSSLYGRSSATLLNGGCSEKDIDEAALWIKNYIINPSTAVDNNLCKRYELYSASNWNVSLLFIRDKIGTEYEAVSLDEILIKRRNKEIINPEREYQVLRVRRRGMGVDVKRVEQGRSILDNMYMVKGNDLVVSAFEADMGGLGYVDKELEGALVPKDLYLFEVDKSRVDLNYLMMVLSSEPVQEQLQAMNPRSHMLSRISMSKFLSVVIPLPNLQTQKAMAKGLQRYVDKVNKAEEELELAKKDFNKKLFGRE